MSLVLDECVTIKTACDVLPDDPAFLQKSLSSPRLAITGTDDTSPSHSIQLDDVTEALPELQKASSVSSSRNYVDVLGGEYLALLGFSGLFDTSKRRHATSTSSVSGATDRDIKVVICAITPP